MRRVVAFLSNSNTSITADMAVVVDMKEECRPTLIDLNRQLSSRSRSRSGIQFGTRTHDRERNNKNSAVKQKKVKDLGSSILVPSSFLSWGGRKRRSCAETGGRCDDDVVSPINSKSDGEGKHGHGHEHERPKEDAVDTEDATSTSTSTPNEEKSENENEHENEYEYTFQMITVCHAGIIFTLNSIHQQLQKGTFFVQQPQQQDNSSSSSSSSSQSQSRICIRTPCTRINKIVTHMETGHLKSFARDKAV